MLKNTDYHCVTRVATVLFLILTLAGCQQPQKQAPIAPLPAFPENVYLEAHARGEPVFAVDGAESKATILVRREGALASLGHDHAIVARPLEGFVLMAGGRGQSRADLRVYARDLQVDPPEARQALDLDTEPTPEDIQGTRENMLGKVLDAENWPEIRVALRYPEQAGTGSEVLATINLRGATQSQTIPMDMQHRAGEIRAGGKLTIRQSDFGIEPLSALGGGLRVSDELQIEFLVVARPVPR
jgi:hypothetical protein